MVGLLFFEGRKKERRVIVGRVNVERLSYRKLRKAEGIGNWMFEQRISFVEIRVYLFIENYN